MGPTRTLGPPGQLGGCFGGVHSPGEVSGFGRSRFFCLLCLNINSKIFQKRNIFKLLLQGTQMGYLLGGAPPGSLVPPQGPPGVTELWKKLQNFPKII